MSALDETLKAADANIAEHGWYGVKFPETEDAPGWEHSIGFTERLGKPEIVVFGLDYDVSHGLIWAVFRAFAKGAAYHDRSVASGIIQGYDCQFRDVLPAYFEDYLFTARARHERRGSVYPFRALQLIWPDERGIFPWESDCDPGIAALQPLLFQDRPGK